MSQQIMNNIIEATKQECQRIEEPKNRSRYFLFGKVDESHRDKEYSVTFENAPDRENSGVRATHLTNLKGGRGQALNREFSSPVS